MEYKIGCSYSAECARWSVCLIALNQLNPIRPTPQLNVLNSISIVLNPTSSPINCLPKDTYHLPLICTLFYQFAEFLSRVISTYVFANNSLVDVYPINSHWVVKHSNRQSLRGASRFAKATKQLYTVTLHCRDNRRRRGTK